MPIFKRKNKAPFPVQVKGRQLEYQVCGNDHFYKKYIQLNTSFLSFLNLDWLNKSGTCFVCSECTHIIWFDAQV